MLFREAIAAAKRNVQLQLFASDVDPQAVATARRVSIPNSIKALVSPERLARFFRRRIAAIGCCRISGPTVVFTVQDVLADPPFSRLDMVSCRNLLIYLGPAAQAKVISLFNFALREGGILLLGSAETVGNTDGFEVVAKPERIYRHVGRSRPGDLSLLGRCGDGGVCRARETRRCRRGRPFSPSYAGGWSWKAMRRPRADQPHA